MEKPVKKPDAERLFPFVLRARKMILGRERLAHSKSRLQFLLVTTDLSETSRADILTAFSHYPIVQKYTSAELEKHLQVRGTKVVGFEKSSLAKSLYAALKEHRLNPPSKSPPAPPPPAATDAAPAPPAEPAAPPPESPDV